MPSNFIIALKMGMIFRVLLVVMLAEAASSTMREVAMIDWLVAITEGVILGTALYLCVRVRMKLGPLVRAKHGQWGRRVV